MAETADALFERLESALSDWASDVESTHEHLAGRLASARERAGSSPEGGVELDQVVASLQSNKVQFSALQEALRQCTDAVKQALERTEQLDNEFASIVEDVRTLKRIAEHTGGAQASFDGMESEAPTGLVDELRALIEDQRERVTQIEQQIAGIGPADGPTSQQWSRMERDFARLRGEVNRLRDMGGVAPGTLEGAVFDEVADPDVIDLDLTGFDNAGRRRRMGDMLIEAGVISQEQVDRALRIQQEQPQRRLGAILIELGYTESDVVAQVLASQARVPFVRLEKDEPDPAAVRLVSERLATHHVCIPVRLEEDDRLVLAMSNPMDLIAIQDIEHATSRSVDPVAASADSIAQAIKAYYGVEAR